MSFDQVKPVLYFIPVALVQLAVVPLISINNIAPNLVFVLLVYFTLKHGQLYGTALGFILGFFLDLISGGLIGAYMFSFTLSAFIAGYFYSENKIDLNTESFFFLLIVFICGSISAFVFGSISNSNTNVNIFFLMLEEGILPGLYTALFGLPMVIFSSRKGII